MEVYNVKVADHTRRRWGGVYNVYKSVDGVSTILKVNGHTRDGWGVYNVNIMFYIEVMNSVDQ